MVVVIIIGLIVYHSDISKADDVARNNWYLAGFLDYQSKISVVYAIALLNSSYVKKSLHF
jgi:hypothetical protein